MPNIEDQATIEPSTRHERFRWHSGNLREVDASMDALSRSIHKAIAAKDEKTVQSLSRHYTLALGMWSEVLLLKVLHEQRAFTFHEIDQILRIAATDRWKELVKLCFRNRFRTIDLNERTLPPSRFSQHKTLMESLENELLPIVNLRNRLAHGQLRYTLRNSYSSIDERLMRQLHRENIVTLQIKRRILFYISRIVRSLAIWHPKFNEHFDKYYSVVISSNYELRTSKYEDYCEELIARSTRGRQYRQRNEAQAG